MVHRNISDIILWLIVIRYHFHKYDYLSHTELCQIVIFALVFLHFDKFHVLQYVTTYEICVVIYFYKSVTIPNS